MVRIVTSRIYKVDIVERNKCSCRRFVQLHYAIKVRTQTLRYKGLVLTNGPRCCGTIILVPWRVRMYDIRETPCHGMFWSAGCVVFAKGVRCSPFHFIRCFNWTTNVTRYKMTKKLFYNYFARENRPPAATGYLSLPFPSPLSLPFRALINFWHESWPPP